LEDSAREAAGGKRGISRGREKFLLREGEREEGSESEERDVVDHVGVDGETSDKLILDRPYAVILIM
jgi:hypothetical protein